MITITIKEREIPLLYTTWEMKEIQEKIAPIERAISLVLGRNPDDKEDRSLYGGPDHLCAAAKMITILGNAGLEESGEDPDLTEKAVMRGLRPGNLPEVINACMDAMAEGMASEIPEKEEDGPVDVTLEEMKKKKDPEG